jgi:hypothetical protein
MRSLVGYWKDSFDWRAQEEMPKGYHFAAMEQPEALAGEIQASYRPLR